MHIKHLFVMTLFTVLTSSALAQGQLNFKNTAQVEVSVRDENTGEVKTELREAELVKPGEIVVFTSVFTNIGENAAENVQVNNPVPENMVYIPFSARGEGASVNYSVDGNEFGSPDSLSVIGEDGRERTARPDEYKEIQWVFDGELAPGESGQVSFKARLL